MSTHDVVKEYWTHAHEKYSARGLGVKTTKFAAEVLDYLSATGTLLDLGAGQGQDSRFFAQHGFTVTSTDLTPAPLALSKKLAAGAGLTINFQEVDVSQPLPFKDETFAVVYSHMALHYFDRETTSRIVSEISRVLQPDGIFATLLNTIEDPETTRPDFGEIEKDYYKTPTGIYKRYFSVDIIRAFTAGYFEPVILDATGKTYKDDIETLIRFIGKKIHE